MSKNKKIKRELDAEIDLLDTMHSVLVEMLQEKGIISEEEYEKRIKARITIK
jgi:hypothetical protein